MSIVNMSNMSVLNNLNMLNETIHQMDTVQITHDKELLKNKMLFDSHIEFLKNGWELKENTSTSIVYTNIHYPTDEFRIDINNRSIKITVPVIGLNYEYSTHFSSYYLANEYLLLHLNNHMNKTESSYSSYSANIS